MPKTNPDIRKLLNKHGEVRIETSTGRFALLKTDGCFYYRVNGCLVGISEQTLVGIINRIPPNIGVIGWE